MSESSESKSENFFFSFPSAVLAARGAALGKPVLGAGGETIGVGTTTAGGGGGVSFVALAVPKRSSGSALDAAVG